MNDECCYDSMLTLTITPRKLLAPINKNGDPQQFQTTEDDTDSRGAPRSDFVASVSNRIACPAGHFSRLHITQYINCQSQQRSVIVCDQPTKPAVSKQLVKRTGPSTHLAGHRAKVLRAAICYAVLQGTQSFRRRFVAAHPYTA